MGGVEMSWSRENTSAVGFDPWESAGKIANAVQAEPYCTKRYDLLHELLQKTHDEYFKQFGQEQQFDVCLRLLKGRLEGTNLIPSLAIGWLKDNRNWINVSGDGAIKRSEAIEAVHLSTNPLEEAFANSINNQFDLLTRRRTDVHSDGTKAITLKDLEQACAAPCLVQPRRGNDAHAPSSDIHRLCGHHALEDIQKRHQKELELRMAAEQRARLRNTASEF